MYQWITAILHFLLDLIYPNHCIPCGEPIREGIFCQNCEKKMTPTHRGNWVENVSHHGGLDRAFSFWIFNDTLQKIIHPMKYKDRARIGFLLGKMAAEKWGSTIVEDVNVLVPVPLHSIKKRERGYNQSYWIAKGMSQVWKIPVNRSLMKRNKYTQSQTTMNREERFKNMEKAFVTSKSVNDMKIAIIDDVLTTGATLSACALTLKKSGAELVMGITCATPKTLK